MTQPLVTAVLVNLNCGPLVDLIFPSIVSQTYPDLEILVIDNGSVDGSCERIEREYPRVKIFRQGRNTGFSHALNVGIREARGAYILSLNFDVTLEPKFVAALVEALERHPQAGWAAGFLRKLSPQGVLDSIDCNGHYWLPSRYCYGYDPDKPEPGSYDIEREVFGASACAALYRVRMLHDLALNGEIFDEDLFAYFEDIDLDWRAQLRGYRCIFTPNARGAHMRGGTGLSRRPEIAALLLANRFLVMLKNDEVKDVLADWSPIVRRTIQDVVVNYRAHPRSLAIALGRLIRLAPRMLRKRRVLRRDRVVSRDYIRSLQVKTDFLG
ncbi:MAG TPA: glycosyltransferase family 2 protein [Gemmatimonadales bacterium]|nr:glycosyltransferase family 2 protein [Gemmatimonadales bacterium]